MPVWTTREDYDNPQEWAIVNTWGEWYDLAKDAADQWALALEIESMNPKPE
jgi:hypothetical protein